MGETTTRAIAVICPLPDLSVSSNGSTWVKHFAVRIDYLAAATFSILERIDVGETMA